MSCILSVLPIIHAIVGNRASHNGAVQWNRGVLNMLTKINTAKGTPANICINKRCLFTGWLPLSFRENNANPAAIIPIGVSSTKICIGKYWIENSLSNPIPMTLLDWKRNDTQSFSLFQIITGEKPKANGLFLSVFPA